MIKGTIEVSGLDKLQEHIDYLKKMIKMKTDKGLQKEIQKRCLELVKQVAIDSIGGNTQPSSDFDLYQSNHKIRETNNGFILYNDTTVPAQSKHSENYPNGEFNVALAFEYGVGIVGEEYNVDPNAWAYDINNHGESGWDYPPDWEHTTGYAGAEVYRYTASVIRRELPNWVKEYFDKIK